MKTRLGHYQIESELGRGGMGVVYKAFEPALNRHVAIKELSPALAHDPQLVERFLREARSMASLSDPHIIQIFFIGTDEATLQPFFAMEFVDGESLSTLLKRDGKLPVDTSLKILHQTAQGLAAAHDHGVIHRDIKPGNLMLTPRGQIKIADFGIALATTDISRKLTSTGEFVGTPGYLSPEVCLGKPVDQRSDILSLGIVLFEMLSGRIPFSDESPLGLMLEVVKAEIPDIQQLNEAVDAATAAILARMVAKDPGQRFQSCHDLVAALEAHPSLLHGNTVKLTQPPAADGATLIGAPTPHSAARPVTPPPLVRSTAAEASETAGQSTETATTRSSVLERPPTRSRSMLLPLTVAAVLVLAVAGGAFAFRAPVMDFIRGYTDGFTGASSTAYEAGHVTGEASNPVATSKAAETLPATVDAEAPAAAPVEPDAADHEIVPEAVAEHASPRLSEEEIQRAIEEDRASTIGTDNTLEIARIDPPAQLDKTHSMPTTAAVTAVAATDSPPNEPEPAPTSAPSPAPTAVVASTTPPKPVAPPPPPRIAVIALGDSALTGPARSRIEHELTDAGFDLVDAEALGLSGSESLATALERVRRSAAVAVVVRAEPVGSQGLQYYGRTSELYIATLSVRAYRTTDRSSIGAGLSEKVQFTTLNADSQARSAVSGKLSRLISDLSPWRRRG